MNYLVIYKLITIDDGRIVDTHTHDKVIKCTNIKYLHKEITDNLIKTHKKYNQDVKIEKVYNEKLQIVKLCMECGHLGE